MNSETFFRHTNRIFVALRCFSAFMTVYNIWNVWYHIWVRHIHTLLLLKNKFGTSCLNCFICQVFKQSSNAVIKQPAKRFDARLRNDQPRHQGYWTINWCACREESKYSRKESQLWIPTSLQPLLKVWMVASIWSHHSLLGWHTLPVFILDNLFI